MADSRGAGATQDHHQGPGDRRGDPADARWRVFAGSYGLSPAALGRAVEERGFGSLFWAEHTHIPVASSRSDGRPVRDFAETYDPFVALSRGGRRHHHPEARHRGVPGDRAGPIVTAKAVASLERVANGRFLFGVGAGWNREELADHGTNPRTRMALLADRVHAMRRIWTDDEAEYHGPFVDFDPVWSWPSLSSDRTHQCWWVGTGRHGGPGAGLRRRMASAVRTAGQRRGA